MGQFKESLLRIEGASQNNLKNINITIPHGRFVVVTGPSGSGKSSLVFDTIFAEGQRRYIESLSTYARQFLERLPRPKVEKIENLTPTIAIEQKNLVKTSRSTVGTLTEIIDFFRLFFVRVGEIYCPNCGRKIEQDTPETIVDFLIQHYKGKKVLILSPLEVSAYHESGQARELLRRLLIRGWTRCYKNEEVVQITEEEKLSGKIFLLAVDQVEIEEVERHRLIEAIEQAYEESGGQLQMRMEGEEVLKFLREWKCSSCEVGFPPVTPQFLSFNSPYGACPECRGFGNILRVDEDLVVPNKTLCLRGGAVDPWKTPGKRRILRSMLASGESRGIDLDKPYAELLPEEVEWLWRGVKGFPGIRGFFARLEAKKYKMGNRVLLSRYKSPVMCVACQGSRIRKEANCVKVRGVSLGELSEWPIAALYSWCRRLRLSQYEKGIVGLVLEDIKARLSFLVEVGVGYLTLGRMTKTLSGGEYQRINISRQLGAGLVETTYVLDEPTIGLHPRDNAQLTAELRKLQDLGNTLIVVEHDPQMIEQAEYLIELGPASGEKGGAIVYAGDFGSFFQRAETLTARNLRARAKIKRSELLPIRRPRHYLRVKNARHNNLKNIDVRFPLHRLVCVTGVSGSGKSSLVQDILYNSLARKFYNETTAIGAHDGIEITEALGGVVLVDQSPIGKSARSNPITYIGGFDEIRALFAHTREAKHRRFDAGVFSFNIAGGRCERCKGQGTEVIEMGFMADVELECEECQGKRYCKDVLEVCWNGYSISDILSLTVDSAADLFRSESVTLLSKLSLLRDVGLGYLQLGQSAPTLSGGESQRIKIARELLSARNSRVLYIMDEPTTGLHMEEVTLLLSVLHRLVEKGNSIIIVEHNLDVIAQSDYCIDLGPEGGEGGGRVVAEGPPQFLAIHPTSYTGQYLRKKLFPSP